MGLGILKIFIPATDAFLIGIALTPFLTHFLYKHKMWKPRAGKKAFDGKEAQVFNSLHAEREVGIPRFGGVIVWGSTLITAGILSLVGMTYSDTPLASLAFISRNQTWVPLAALAAGSLVGFFDDWFEVRGRGGLRLRIRLVMVALISTLCALWFYDKLDVSSVTIPFRTAPLELGIWFVPFFICVTLFMYAGGVIDGIDGLAGGVFASIFIAYAGISFFQHQLDLAALCAAIAGALLAFVWFNIPPARFYLSETGTMGLTITLAVVAFLTDTIVKGRGVAVLPIIGVLLIVTVLSNLIQIFGKKVLHRKIFRIAPLHHHFEALGWPPYKVTMRYWIVGLVAAIIGITVAIL